MRCLTARPWKLMVSRLLSYWEGNFSRLCYYKLRGVILGTYVQKLATSIKKNIHLLMYMYFLYIDIGGLHISISLNSPLWVKPTCFFRFLGLSWKPSETIQFMRRLVQAHQSKHPFLRLWSGRRIFHFRLRGFCLWGRWIHKDCSLHVYIHMHTYIYRYIHR